jgi:two-component system C4-dicarboxylate transport response regulator DctD
MSQDKASEKGTILVVEDDPSVRDSLQQWLELNGFIVRLADSAPNAISQITDRKPDAVLSDVLMPGMDGLELVDALVARWPELPVLLLTGHGDVPMAVRAMRSGAFDFMTKPYDPERLVAVVTNAVRQSRLQRRVAELETDVYGAKALEARLVGASAVMQSLRRMIMELASYPIDIVLEGETGTGKEVVARALHDFGPRRNEPFVAINCAAIPAEMIESELFGHEIGAFTGARAKRIGKFEYATKGTLFLDEVESMPLSAQAKVLRALQERYIERLGSNREIPVDIRIISATKVDLRKFSAEGQFRQDLYFRLAGAEIPLPPLRERENDAVILFEMFSNIMSARVTRTARPLTPEERHTIMHHGWPGNVRELKAAAERHALGLAWSSAAAAMPDTKPIGGSLNEHMARYERELIVRTLAQCNGSISEALAILEIPRRTLNDKMARLGITRLDYKESAEH